MSEMDFTPGRWAVIKGPYGALDPLAIQIDTETEKLIREKERRGCYFQHNKRDVVATFSTENDAAMLIQKIAGIRGEMSRRITAARDAASKAVADAIRATKGDKA